MKGNGPMIEKRADGLLSADAIRKEGHSVAEHIRSLGEEAEREGKEVANYATDMAEAIIAASEEVANQVNQYMERCRAARASMKEHQEAMTQTKANPVAEAVGPAAVANALNLPGSRQ